MYILNNLEEIVFIIILRFIDDYRFFGYDLY